MLAACRGWRCLQGWTCSVILSSALTLSALIFTTSADWAAAFSLVSYPFYVRYSLVSVFLFSASYDPHNHLRPLWFSDSSLGNYRQVSKQAVSPVSEIKLVLQKALVLDSSWLWPVIESSCYCRKNINLALELILLSSNPSPANGCVTSGTSAVGLNLVLFSSVKWKNSCLTKL